MTRDNLLAYARLLHRLYRRRAEMPKEWALIQRRKHWLTGFKAMVFRHGADGEVVVAIKGVRPWDIRDLVSVPIRRTIGYPRSTLRFARRMLEQYGSKLTIVGHSGGGGIASWLGAELGVPTVTFNSGRTKAALRNDGSRQINVFIRGDKWGDPERGFYAMPLKGETIVLDPPPGVRGKHMMGPVVKALKRRETR